jgi:excisionase family DNA binding protein
VPREALWTAKEAAEHLRCSKSFIYKAAERDRLPAIRIGRMLRFSPEAVRAFAGQPGVVAG